MMMLGEAKGVVTLDISDLSAKAGMAASQLGAMDSMGGKGFSNVNQQLAAVGVTSNMVGKGMVAMGAAMLAPMVLGTKHAIDLQQAFRNIEAALPKDQRGDMERLKQVIIDIGASGEYSATEIAMVSEELTKAGRTVDEQISGNMIQAVSDLASATGSGLQPAVLGISSAMQMWSPNIVDSSIALTDASRAADIFTVAANSSYADITDIIAGMRNFGPTAAQMGIGFDEAAASIAVMTNYGLKANVASTALNTAMTRLANPTSKASKAMKALGIDAFTASGEFIGMPALFDNLANAMKGLSAEQRVQALATIFGLEAMDAMALAALTGGDEIRAITGDMQEYGTAAEQAALKTDTVKGALERMFEGIATLGIVLADGLLVPTRLVADAIDFLVAMVLKVPKPILSAIGLFTAMSGALLLVGGGAILLAPKLTTMLTVLRSLAAMQGGVSGLARALLLLGNAARIAAIAFGIFGVAAGIGFLAYQKNFLGFGDTVRRFTKNFTGWWADMTGASEKSTENVSKQFKGMVETVHGSQDAIGDDGTAWFYTELDDNGVPQRIGQIVESKEDLDGDNKVEVKIRTDDGEYWTWLDLNTGEIVGESTVEVEAKDKRGTVAKMRGTLQNVRDWLESKDQPFLASMVGGLDKALVGLTNVGDYFNGLFGRVKLFNSLFNALRGAGRGFFDSLGTAAGRVFYKEIGAVKRLGSALKGLALSTPDFARWTIDVAAPTLGGWIKRAGDSAWGFISSAAGWSWDRGTEIKRWTLDVARPRVTGWIKRAGRSVMDGISNAAGWGSATFSRMRSWTLDVGIPKVQGAFASVRGSAMDFIRRAMGFGTSLYASLRSWTLDIGIPTLTGAFGSVAGAAGDLWGVIRGAIGGALSAGGSLIASLGAWTLDVGLPKLTGFLSGVGDDLWSLLQRAVGIGGNLLARLGAWTLDVAVPTVTGWIVSFASGAWSAITSAAGWVGGQISATLGDWGLDIPSPSDVTGWLSDFAIDPMGELEDVIDGLKDLRADLETWTLDVAEPNVKSLLGDFNEWLLGKTGINAQGTIAGLGTWFLLVGVPTVKALFETAAIILDIVGGVIVGLGRSAWTLLLGRPTILFGFDIDRAIENVIGKLIGEPLIDVIIDIAWGFEQDPMTTLKRILGAMFITGLLINIGISGFWPVIAPLAILLLGAYVVKQLYDYFQRNPQKLEELRIEIGRIWTSLEAGQFGSLFTALRKIGEAAIWTAKKGKELYDWLQSLPGPLGDVVDWATKATVALLLLNSVAMFGGVGKGASGGSRKGVGGSGGRGWLGGLLNGLLLLTLLPFKAVINPIGTLKGLIGRGSGRASGGRSGSWLLHFGQQLKFIAGAPFRFISSSLKGLKTGFNALASPWARSGTIASKLGRSLLNLWRAMAFAPNAVGMFLKPIHKFAAGLVKAVMSISSFLIRAGKLIGVGRLAGVFSGIFSSMMVPISIAFRGIARALTVGIMAIFKPNPAQLAAVGKWVRDIGRALFGSKFGIIASPKAFQAFSMLSVLFGRLRGLVGRLVGPFRSLGRFFLPLITGMGRLTGPFGRFISLLGRLAGPLRFLLSPLALLGRGFLALVPALGAIGPVGWVILAVIGALVAGFIAWKTNFLGFRDALQGAWGGIQSIFESMGESIQRLRDAFDVGGWSGLFREMGTMFGEGLRGLGQAAWDAIQWVGDRIRDGFNAIRDFDIGSFFSNLWDGIWGAVTSIQWGAVWDTIWSAISGINWSGLYDKGVELITSLWDGIRGNWQKILFWFAVMPIAIPIAIGSLAVLLLSKGAELIGGLLKGAVDALPKVMFWLGSLAGRLLTAIGPLAGKLLSKGAELIGGLLRGAIDALPKVMFWLGTLAGRIAQGVGSLARTLFNKGVQLISGFLEGVHINWGRVLLFFALLPVTLPAAIGYLGAKLIQKGAEFIGGLLVGIAQQWPAIVIWLASLPGKAVNAIGNVANLLISAGFQFLYGFMEGIGLEWDQIAIWLAGLPNRLTSGIGTLGGLLVNKGRSFLGGLFRGVVNYWEDTVKPWFSDMASRVEGLVPDGVGTAFDTIISALEKVIEVAGRAIGALEKFFSFFGGGGGTGKDTSQEGTTEEEYDEQRGDYGTDAEDYGATPVVPVVPGKNGTGDEQPFAPGLARAFRVLRSESALTTIALRTLSGVTGTAKLSMQALGLTSTGARAALMTMNPPLTLAGSGFTKLGTDVGVARTTVGTHATGITNAIRVGASQWSTLPASAMAMFKSAITTNMLSSKLSVDTSMSGIRTKIGAESESARAASAKSFLALRVRMSQESSDASSAVSRNMNTMALNTSQKLDLMRLQAQLKMSQVTSSLRNGATNGINAVSSVLGRLASIVSAAGSKAAFAASAAGRNIGNSFASGMESALGRIRAAANAMADAAQTALRAKLVIGSPSKVFIGLGKDTGIGLPIGLEKTLPAIIQAGRKIAERLSATFEQYRYANPMWAQWNPSTGPDMRASASSARPPRDTSRPQTVTNYNTYDVDVVQQPGEDGERLAQRIITILRDGDADAEGE